MMCSTELYSILSLEHLSLRIAEGQGRVVRGSNGVANEHKKRDFCGVQGGTFFLNCLLLHSVR